MTVATYNPKVSHISAVTDMMTTYSSSVDLWIQKEDCATFNCGWRFFHTCCYLRTSRNAPAVDHPRTTSAPVASEHLPVHVVTRSDPSPARTLRASVLTAIHSTTTATAQACRDDQAQTMTTGTQARRAFMIPPHCYTGDYVRTHKRDLALVGLGRATSIEGTKAISRRDVNSTLPLSNSTGLVGPPR